MGRERLHLEAVARAFKFALGSFACTPQEVVGGWSGYSLEMQQDLFDAALVVASEGDWGQLEGQLRLALDLTSEG